MTDPLIAAGSDELNYRYPGAMRWSPDWVEVNDGGLVLNNETPAVVRLPEHDPRGEQEMARP